MGKLVYAAPLLVTSFSPSTRWSESHDQISFNSSPLKPLLFKENTISGLLMSPQRERRGVTKLQLH